MDFEIVITQIVNQYAELYGLDENCQPWSVKDCVKVFNYFYKRYKATQRKQHPKLSNRTIQSIIENLPFCALQNGDYIDLYPEDYIYLIDSYFKTPFKSCNYSLAHFMSGDIRAYRLLEYERNADL